MSHDPTCTVVEAHSDEDCNGNLFLSFAFRYDRETLNAVAVALTTYLTSNNLLDRDEARPTWQRIKNFRDSILLTLKKGR